MSLFDAVRHISAREAAERAGLHLQLRGGNAWACCPLHGEHTPSMCLYDEPERGWYCYGCDKGGDATKLYEELYHAKPMEAARMLAADFGIVLEDSKRAGPAPEPLACKRHAERAAEALHAKLLEVACGEKWRAQVALDKLHNEGTADWDNSVFIAALKVRSLAEERIAALDSYGLDEKLEQLDEGGASGE